MTDILLLQACELCAQLLTSSEHSSPVKKPISSVGAKGLYNRTCHILGGGAGGRNSASPGGGELLQIASSPERLTIS